MNNATIVHQLPGKTVPEEYLKKVRVLCPSAFGYAYQINGKLEIDQTKSTPTLEELVELCSLSKDGHLVMWFGNLASAVLPDDIQPFSLNDGAEPESRNFLALTYEGDFPKYSGLNGKHTDEYCVADEVIFPRLDKAFRDAGKDIDKFIESLREENIQKSIAATFSHRGAFVFLPETGDPILFGQNTLGSQYPWGGVSQVHGYSEKPAVVEQVKEAAKSGLSFLRGRTSSTAAITTPAPVQPQHPHPDADKGKEEIVLPKPKDVKIEDGVTYTKIGPPPKIFSHNKAWNLWLRTFNRGEIPSDHQSKDCKIWVPEDLVEYASRPMDNKDDVQRLAGEIHAFKRAKAGSVDQKVHDVLVGDGEKKPIIRSTVREKASSAADYIPVMSDSDKEKYMDMIAKYLSKSKRPGPLETQKMESKFPSFSETTGTKFDENMTLTISEFKEMFGDAAALFILEMRAKILQLGYKIPDVVEPQEEPKTFPAGGNKLSFLRGRKTA